MAEDKKSFLLYADMIHTVKKMPPDKAGELFLTILSYVNDGNPSPNDLLVEIAFEPIKQQLKRDLRRWEDFRAKQSDNGKLGGRPKKPTVEKGNPKNPSLLDESQKSLNVTVNVTDNVNVNDNESVNEKPLLAPEILQKSNLFRKPNIPDLPDVQFAFVQLGGTKEMAQTFYEKNEALGWFLSGGPITNFRNLVPSFIKNWKLYENKTNGKFNGQPAKIDSTKVNHSDDDRF